MMKQRLKFFLVICLLQLNGVAPSALAASKNAGEENESQSKFGKQYILLHTSAGDLVLGLYPKVAPRHVEQILKLVKNGAYDGTYFYRVDPGFLAQIASVQDRLTPLTAEQQALIKKIPAEFSQLRHRHGMLSMARDEGDLNSAESSFSILLGDAPHLDGHYTIFGRVAAGNRVLEEIARVSRDLDNRPQIRIGIDRAEVIEEPFPALAPPVSMRIEPAHPESATPVLNWSVFGIGLILILTSGFALIRRLRLSSEQIVNFHLMTYFLGAFLVAMTGLYLQIAMAWLGVLFFFFLVATFRILSHFEVPQKKGR